MTFKSIFVANLSEVARPLARLMKRERRQDEIWEDHALCDRFLFGSSDNRLLVTPFPIDLSLLVDGQRLLGLRNILNLSPRRVGESLCESVLRDRKLLKFLVGTIRANGGIRLISYGATPEFLKLIRFLKNKGLKFETPEVPPDENYWTTEFFDSKAGFRQIAQYLNGHLPSMPEGATAHGFSEVAGWVRYFLLEKGTGCVLKTNRGLAGAGLRIIRKGELGSKNITRYLKHLFSQGPFWSTEPTVVEEFIEPEVGVCGGAPNIELRIQKGQVAPLYVCGMRVTRQGAFRGVELGQGAVPRGLKRELINYGKKFGRFLNRFGYQGFYETDFVLGRGRQLYPIEANLRRTGGTDVYLMCQRLLSANFIDDYYVNANNIQPAPRFRGQNYSQVKEALKDLLFPIRGKKEGVIVTIVSLLKRGELGYVVVGKGKDRVYQIEKDFLQELNS